ncbi:hypothetical protein [Salininema proteolyticum]|uniref:Spore-associated protein A n=1 Tax=Salininema proteolyticum TaxID=1607685 RepID=A0ABV8U4Z7_9ACTN
MNTTTPSNPADTPSAGRGRLAKRLAVALAAIAAFSLSAVAIPGTASAAGPCGSSYALVGHYPIKDSYYGTVAYIDVYWSSTSKRNCAVTNGTGATYGLKRHKGVSINPSSSSGRVDSDSGAFSYYAGPVYTPRGYNLSGECIDVDGTVGLPGGNEVTGRYLSRVHCG